VGNLGEFQKKLGYTFNDESLLRLALTHPSIAHEGSAHTPHNQRLEFLGDAVLGLVLAQELYLKFPNLEEGPLTKARAQMANSRTLAGEAKRHGLGDELILSRGEQTSGGRHRTSALADAFEALLGAMFLDGGYDAVRAFILRSFKSGLGEAQEVPNLHNPKGELQELLQSESPEAPQYQVASVTGPDHDRIFECIVSHRGMELGRGQGKSKKAAESQAASAAMQHLKNSKHA
jgi:ribonuclease III